MFHPSRTQGSLRAMSYTQWRGEEGGWGVRAGEGDGVACLARLRRGDKGGLGVGWGGRGGGGGVEGGGGGVGGVCGLNPVYLEAGTRFTRRNQA